MYPGLIVPQGICYTSHKKVWWTCKQCENDFQMSPASRTLKGSGCSICGHKRGGIKNHLNSLKNGNDLYSWCINNGKYGEKIIEEWDNQKNKELLGIEISDVSFGYGKKVFWVCGRCKNGFESTVSHRTIVGSGCKHCNKKSTSFPEQLIYHALKQIYDDTINRGKAFNQIEYDICVPSKSFCVEYNGAYWHKNRAERDEMKRKICEINNVRLIQINANNKGVEWEFSENVISYRISYSRHLEQLRQIIEYILNILGHDITEISWDKLLDDVYRVMYDEVENNVTIIYPELIKEWDKEKNGSLKPEYFTAGSRKRIFWTCYKCKNIWSVSIKSRTRFKTGCPQCGYNIFDGKIHSKAKNKKNSPNIMLGQFSL